MDINEFIKITNLSGYSEEGKIDFIGKLFDLSNEQKSIDGINHGLTLLKQIKRDKLNDTSKTVLDYIISNGFCTLRILKYSQTKSDWYFQFEELTKEIFHLRKAMNSNGFKNLDEIRKCQIYTNLGNTFSYIGRFVEAQEYWKKAIIIEPKFAMAICNKAKGTLFYSNKFSDVYQKLVLYIYAYKEIKICLDLKKYLRSEIIIDLENSLKILEKIIGEKHINNLPEFKTEITCEDDELRNYRNWCLNNILYLNPLNDIDNIGIACSDCINAPPIISEIKNPLIFFSLFNQIKQEYGTARYYVYNSVMNHKPHFSDLDIKIIDTLDNSEYSFYIENLKIAFRMSYSILDKIAFLLNEFFKLGIPNHLITFKSIWFSNNKGKEIAPIFTNSSNWALRGLYWLSKDLYEKDEDLKFAIEPEAKEIATIRNFIEHKSFKVLTKNETPFNFNDDSSYTILRSNLEKKTLKLLKLARASIIYLSIALLEESQKIGHSNNKDLPKIILSEVPFFKKK